MSVTIKHIAKMANVSITTVSRVINHKSEGVSEAKRLEILNLLEAHHYQPNNVARSLVTSRSKTLGCIIPDITNPFFPNIARGAEDVAMAHGYNLFLCNSDGRSDKETKYLEVLREKRVDGLIFTACESLENPDTMNGILSIDTPMVFVDEPFISDDILGVFPDDFHGSYQAVRYLLDLGHTAIACLAGPSSTTSAKKRSDGYRAALSDAGISAERQCVRHCPYTVDAGYRCMNLLLDQQPDVTAIFATNDLIAYGVYQAIREHNLTIPADYSVIGFDDLIISEFLSPPLTTIQVNAYELGAKAATLLIKKIMDQPIDEKIVWVGTELIVRDSVRKMG